MASHSKGRRPSARETAASAGVLLVLAIICVWLWRTQSKFSPAVTVAASATREAESSRPTAPVAAAAPDLFPQWPAGLKTMSAAESFTPDSLSDKIDGKAELYLSAGFVGMRCQRVASTTAPDSWFEAFIYDMGKPVNAFSVYSSQKRNTTQAANLGDYSYRAGNQLCLVHGQFYLEFVAADEREPTLAAATELARAFIAQTAVAQHANVAKDEALFPTEGMIAGSIMLLSADVFGFDQLNNTYVARYRDGTDDVTLFLSRRPDAAAAAQLATALRDFYVKDCGGKESAPPSAPKGATLIDSGAGFDGVFTSGAYVAGVHQAPNTAAAERWMLRLFTRLAAPTP